MLRRRFDDVDTGHGKRDNDTEHSKRKKKHINERRRRMYVLFIGCIERSIIQKRATLPCLLGLLVSFRVISFAPRTEDQEMIVKVLAADLGDAKASHLAIDILDATTRFLARAHADAAHESAQSRSRRFRSLLSVAPLACNGLDKPLTSLLERDFKALQNNRTN